MSVLFLEYPKCTTCKNAKAWLTKKNIDFVERDIATNNPTVDELTRWYQQSNLPLKRFFNSSGNVYKELELKSKIDTMSEEQQLAILATNGMLVKRPLLIGDDFILVGFKEDEWKVRLG